jgi:hypothetical protein
MDVTSQYQQHYLGIENLATAFPPQNQQHAIMAVANLLDSSLPESVLSEEKSQEIIDLIKERFNDQDHTPVAKQKEHILEGDRNNDSHVLSRNMMQTYISSYWWNFHPQLPICMLNVPSYPFDFKLLIAERFSDQGPTVIILICHSTQTDILARQDFKFTVNRYDGYWCVLSRQDVWVRHNSNVRRIVQLFGLASPMGDLWECTVPASCKALGFPSSSPTGSLREGVLNERAS